MMNCNRQFIIIFAFLACAKLHIKQHSNQIFSSNNDDLNICISDIYKKQYQTDMREVFSGGFSFIFRSVSGVKLGTPFACGMCLSHGIITTIIGIKYYGYGLNCSIYSDNEQSSLILLAILFLIVLIPDALE